VVNILDSKTVKPFRHGGTDVTSGNFLKLSKSMGECEKLSDQNAITTVEFWLRDFIPPKPEVFQEVTIY
jgi:hypothetical protein